MIQNNFLQYFSTISCGLTVMSGGISAGWTTIATSLLTSKHSPIPMSSKDAVLIANSTEIGFVTGLFFFYLMFNKVGRKTMILIILPSRFFGWMLIGFTKRAETWIVARICLGISSGVSYSTAVAYISEIADAKIRGQLGTISEIAYSFGMFLIVLLGTYFPPKTCAIIVCSIFVVEFICIVFIPESPYFLLLTGNVKNAEINLKRLNPTQNVKERLVEMKISCPKEPVSFRKLLSKKINVKLAILILGSRLLYHFSGIYPMNYFLKILLKEIHLKDSLNPVLFSYYLVQLVFGIISFLLVDRLGRKCLLVSSQAGLVVSLTILSIFFYIRKYYLIDIIKYRFIPLVAIFMYDITIYLGIASLIGLLSGENAPLSIKKYIYPLVDTLGSILVILLTNYFQFISSSVGEWLGFLTFAILSFAGFLFFAKYFVETNGKTLEQIQN